MVNLSKDYEQIRSFRKVDRGPCIFKYFGDFYLYVRSFFPEEEQVRATSFLKLLMIEYLSFDVKFQESLKRLMTVLYLYGPELVGHEKIIFRHPVLDPRGGTLVEKEGENEVGAIDSYNEEEVENYSSEGMAIGIYDERRFLEVKKKYKEYESDMGEIAKIVLNNRMEDQITLAYNVVLDRERFDPKHNILGIKEATSPVIWDTLGQNLYRMRKCQDFHESTVSNCLEKITSERLPSIEIDKNDINNRYEVKECLKKEGSRNNLVTYIAIYILNALGYPTGTKSGIILPRTKKSAEFIYRLLAPYYLKQHLTLNWFKKVNHLTYDVITDDENYRSPKQSVEHKARMIYRDLQSLRTQVTQVVDTSIENLTELGLIEEIESSFLVKGCPAFLNEATGKIERIQLKSEEEINGIDRRIRQVGHEINDINKTWQRERGYQGRIKK